MPAAHKQKAALTRRLFSTPSSRRLLRLCKRRKPSSQLVCPASRGPIFQQEQIARAVELGLGVDRPEKIRLLVDDDDIESQAYAILVQNQLLRE